MRNVICIKWGDKYGPDYVNKLYSMARRHLSGPVRFLCVTDNAEGIDPGVEIRPLPAMDLGDVKFTSGWRKLSIFSPELSDVTGPILFLDLDVVIVDGLDPFFDFEPGRFCIIENWTQRGQNVGNSSVFRYERAACQSILERYEAEHDAIVRQFDNEQMYLTAQASPVAFWPDAWCRSFKRHCLGKGLFARFTPPHLPDGVRIIVFHGYPNPPEAAIGRWPRTVKSSARSWRHPIKAVRNWLLPVQKVPPPLWIDEHWK